MATDRRDARTPPGWAERPAGLRPAFIATALFFTASPLLALLTHPPQPPALAMLLTGWAIFAAVIVDLFRGSPFVAPRGASWQGAAALGMGVLATVAELAYGPTQGAALFFYAGVTAARLAPNGLALGGIAGVAAAASVSLSVATADVQVGLSTGVTVTTISLTLFALGALGRANRALHEAREELAQLAVARERIRIARDLHDTLGHSLALIALKTELAGRLLESDPARAGAEVGDAERVAREALTSVRETVSGYRRPSLASELAAARAAFAVAGIDGQVDAAPVPDGEADALLGWAVREGVTNILRHSRASTARIQVRMQEGHAELEVLDDGGGRAAQDREASPTDDGTGLGLVGLRERATQARGRFEAGPLPGGGFRLALSVPIGGAE